VSDDANPKETELRRRALAWWNNQSFRERAEALRRAEEVLGYPAVSYLETFRAVHVPDPVEEE
jgi:hypothetical protein